MKKRILESAENCTEAGKNRAPAPLIRRVEVGAVTEMKDIRQFSFS